MGSGTVNSILSSGGKNNLAGKAGAKDAAKEEKEKQETSHNVITCNHMENNYHLSNKKALYYNMKVYYESIN